MMSSMYGDKIKISIFGQSHSESIGVVVDGLPAGFTISMEELDAFMARRAPGGNAYSTSRKEPDKVHFLSGLVNQTTCGAPLCAVIENTSVKSSDYDNLQDIPRPSHADYTANVKHHGFQDLRGGGHFSGRLTAPLCIAGAICIQVLKQKGIHIGAHIASIATIPDDCFSPIDIPASLLIELNQKEFPVLNFEAGFLMKECIAKAKQDSDSVGGIIECAIIGMPVGIGNPMFDGIENRISSIVFGIPAVKGIEFGNGFASTMLRGSENNDPFVIDGDGGIKTSTNHHGGILGGISSGMPILFSTAIKPTPSIGQEQDSVSLSENTPAKLVVHGRHDPCIVPRAVPCIEAAAAIAIINLLD